LGVVYSVAFSADGKRLVGGSNNSVMVWDEGKGQVVRTFRGDTSPGVSVVRLFIDLEIVTSLGFSADGKRIVATIANVGIRSWDAIKGHEVTPCTDPPPPDGQREAVSPDGKVRIWADRANVLARASPPRAGLAIEIVPLSKSSADKWGLPSKSQPQIAFVHAGGGGGGAKMGLQRDDVVLRINARDVLAWKQADNALRGLKTGASVEFVVLRAGKQLKLVGPNETQFPLSEEVPRLLALAANDPGVQTLVGYHYADGEGVAKSDAEAVKWFRKAADAGDALGQVSLGTRYQFGLGLPKDEDQALKWYRKAAEQEYANAQYRIGGMYYDGLGVAKDYQEAMKWYRKAAEQDNAAAQTNIGGMYYNGQGVAQDYKEAMQWYKKAAERGYAVAQTNIGVMYYKGQGVAQDYKEAMQWYKKAAEQGDAAVQNEIGSMYAKGQGVVKDHDEAMKWFKKAAEQGNAVAQFNIGQMYYNGQGVAKDYKEAIQWYKKAAEQGNAGAQV
jgi:TPR repeat protein